MNEYTAPNGETYEVGPAARGPQVEKLDLSKVGLGTWRIGHNEDDAEDKHSEWVYIAPSGWEYATSWFVKNSPTPPPLPQPKPRVAHCHCGPTFAHHAVSLTTSSCMVGQMVSVHTVMPDSKHTLTPHV